jgi:hypothetical protein
MHSNRHSITRVELLAKCKNQNSRIFQMRGGDFSREGVRYADKRERQMLWRGVVERSDGESEHDMTITKRAAKRLVKDRAPYSGVTYDVLKYFVDAVHVNDKKDSIDEVQFSRTVGTIALSIRSTPRTVEKSITQLMADSWVKTHAPNTYSICLEPMMKLPTRAELKRESNRNRQHTWYDRHKRASTIADSAKA